MGKKDQVQIDYDFKDKDPSAILTADELAHFDEGMQLKNTSQPADQVDMKKAVQATIRDFDKLFP